MSILWQTLSTAFSSSQRAKRKAFTNLKAGQYAKAAVHCENILRADPSDLVGLRVLADIADIVVAAAERFKRNSDEEAVRSLRAIRFEFTILLQSLPINSIIATNSLAIAHAHSALLASGVRNIPRDGQEKLALNRLCAKLEIGGDREIEASTLLAAMLLSYGTELPLPHKLTLIPKQIREKYCLFLFDVPEVFQHPGEVVKCFDHRSKVLKLVLQECTVNHAVVRSPYARRIADIAITPGILVQTYMNTRNLREMMKMRGELISAALILSGATTLEAHVPRFRTEGKIKLGVVTISLGPQTDAHFTASHIDHLDRSKFHIILYVLNSTGSPLERHCIARTDHFEVLPVDDVFKQAERIRADDLDILLIGSNTSAVTNAPALFGSLRLARTQIATACSPSTTGLRHMDVLLSAQLNEPEQDAPEHYTEQLWLMPGSVNCYAYQYDITPATISFNRTNLNIPDGAIIFFSGANVYKIIPELSLTWARILTRVPDSVLVLMPFNPNWSDSYQKQQFVSRIERQLTESGIAPERLRIIDPVPARADVLRIVAIADIYLDAYPFAGACSMLDPMIAGVPSVVRCGPVGRSHHGAALMRMAGLEEAICTSEDDYISTAIELASNPERRQRIRSVLNALNAQDPPPYFDTRAFSSKVGTALIEIHNQYLARYHALETAGPVAMRKSIQALADSVVGRNLELAALNDTGMIPSLIKPYFRNRRVERPHHMIDVGACFGVMADPLLADGWTADLFEPDPSPRPTLERNVRRYGTRCRVFAMAVSNGLGREVEFHQSYDGLSGLGESPFKSTEAIIKVPCMRLTDFYIEHGVKVVDFLKIDAEGHDFDVLYSHDFTTMRPSLVMVEYGTHFATESLAVVNQAIERMAAAGYGSVIFNYDDDGKFSKGNFTYRLTEILLDQPLPDFGRVAFGNILFYQADDADFLTMLYSLLDTCRPRSQSTIN